MIFLRRLFRIEFVAAQALIIVAVLFAIYAAVIVIVGKNNVLSIYGSARVTFFGALYFGFPATILFGAPIYALLEKKKIAIWPIVIILGTIPGAIMLFVDKNLGIFALISGTVVASYTHILCRNGSNKSLKDAP